MQVSRQPQPQEHQQQQKTQQQTQQQQQQQQQLSAHLQQPAVHLVYPPSVLHQTTVANAKRIQQLETLIRTERQELDRLLCTHTIPSPLKRARHSPSPEQHTSPSLTTSPSLPMLTPTDLAALPPAKISPAANITPAPSTIQPSNASPGSNTTLASIASPAPITSSPVLTPTPSPTSPTTSSVDTTVAMPTTPPTLLSSTPRTSPKGIMYGYQPYSPPAQPRKHPPREMAARGSHWSFVEKARFEAAMHKYGPFAWEQIIRVVGSRSEKQVKAYAARYRRRKKLAAKAHLDASRAVIGKTAGMANHGFVSSSKRVSTLPDPSSAAFHVSSLQVPLQSPPLQPPIDMRQVYSGRTGDSQAASRSLALSPDAAAALAKAATRSSASFAGRQMTWKEEQEKRKEEEQEEEKVVDDDESKVKSTNSEDELKEQTEEECFDEMLSNSSLFNGPLVGGVEELADSSENCSSRDVELLVDQALHGDFTMGIGADEDIHMNCEVLADGYPSEFLNAVYTH